MPLFYRKERLWYILNSDDLLCIICNVASVTVIYFGLVVCLVTYQEHQVTVCSGNCLLKQECILLIACDFVIDMCSVILALALATVLSCCFSYNFECNFVWVDRRISCFMFSSAVSSLYLTFFCLLLSLLFLFLLASCAA